MNNQLITNNAKLSLSKSKGLLDITDKILEDGLSVEDERWEKVIFAWADILGIPESEIPRDKQKIKSLRTLNIWLSGLSKHIGDFYADFMNEFNDLHESIMKSELFEIQEYDDEYGDGYINISPIEAPSELKNLNIETLNIKNYTTDGDSFLLSLYNNLNIKSLQIQSCNSSNCFSEKIFEMKSIENLHIIPSPNQYHEWEVFSEISKLKNLKKFGLTHSQIENIPIELTQLKNLEELDLSNNFNLKLDKNSVLFQLKNLRKLNIKYHFSGNIHSLGSVLAPSEYLIDLDRVEKGNFASLCKEKIPNCEVIY